MSDRLRAARQPTPASKIALPDVETCTWRRAREGSDGSATCGLLATLLQDESAAVTEVSREACAACCQSFPPSPRHLNPIVASLLIEKIPSSGEATDPESPLGKLKQRAIHALPIQAERGPGSSSRHRTRCRAARTNHVPRRATRISRRLTLKELCPFPVGRSGQPVTHWSVGVTTAPRGDATLAECLDSVRDAGWTSPHLFMDSAVRMPERFGALPVSWREQPIGALGAWYLALCELLIRDPDADAYLLMQDDVIFPNHEPLRAYLEEVLWPFEGAGVVSLFYTGVSTEAGWKRARGECHWGAQAYVFPPEIARAVASSEQVVSAALKSGVDRHIPIPEVLHAWAWQNRVEFWYPVPSLAQHIGGHSTLWPSGRITLGRWAPWYSGDIDEATASENALDWFDESAVPGGRPEEATHLARIRKGRERMGRSTVVICGLCRDTRHYLPRTAARVERLAAMFRDYQVILFENDSTDATLEFLKDWQAIDPRVTVLSDQLGEPRFPRTRSLARARAMARYRNVYHRHAVTRHRDYDYVIVLDTDLPGGWSYDGIAHTFGTDGWDVVGSYGLTRRPDRSHPFPFSHFDVWAFRPAQGTCASDLVDHQRLHLQSGDPMLPVESCFGGLAVYSMAAFASAEYQGNDCEHVDFHRAMREQGFGRQFLNPNQVTLYSPC